MVISHNSQLGLRFTEKPTKREFYDVYSKYIKSFYTNRKDVLDKKLVTLRGLMDMAEKLTEEEIDRDKEYYFNLAEELVPSNDKEDEIITKVNGIFGIDPTDITLNDEGKYYLICESVYKAAELIKVSSGFTGRTLKDISFGKHTYLLGKNEMVRFKVGVGAIKGFYYNDKENIVFEWGVEIEEGGYYFDKIHQKEFSKIMQVLTFVELGDIEILEVQGGRNNGGKRDIDKITNTTKNTVYVVDSTWNKIIIRTDGFAVRGHFRLQPCGKNMADRTLIWISAFEKHGYKRTPKASIVR